jgi:hypothetical protein
MAETPLHQNLTRTLRARMRGWDIRITHAAGVVFLPDPYRVGRHAPDVIGWRRGWRYVGEAKRGPELFDEHTQEQLRDFSRSFTPQGRRSHFILCVPSAYREAAREAIVAARGNIKNVTIVSPARVRGRRNRVARATPYQRERVKPAAAPGTPLQRGRKRTVSADVLAAAQRAALRKLHSG